MNFISVLHSSHLYPLSTYPSGGEGSRWRIANILPLAVGGEWFGSTPKSTSTPFSLTTPEKDRVCHPAICNQYPRLHRQEAMENEGAMGLTHRSCFRVAAAPTLATKRSYDSQDHFGRSPVFEGKMTGEKGGCQVARGALVVGMRNPDHYQCT